MWSARSVLKLNIVRRQFAKVDDKWIEIEDLRQRDLTAERTWSSFCLFIPTEQPDAVATTLRIQTTPRHVDIVPSLSGGGVWLMGAHYQLEALLPHLPL